MTSASERLRQQILELTARYLADAFPPSVFRRGISPVPVFGKAIDVVDERKNTHFAMNNVFWIGVYPGGN